MKKNLKKTILLYGGEEFSHYEYTGISLIKAPNGQVWNKDEKMHWLLQ